jgi:predicted ATP-grasp superfamily ATP-dependent carboligase
MRSISIDEVAPAMRSLEVLLPAVGYRGIYSAEFKLDARDGTFKILEVNTRPWWYVEFAALCGVDVCTMAYRDALGLEVSDVTTYEVGARCVNARTDLLASRASVRSGETSWARALASWIGARQAIFRAEDPVPALVDLAQRARRRIAGSGAR